MNFQSLIMVEKADFYLDIAFRQGKEAAERFRQKKCKDRLTKSKSIELERIKAVEKSLDKSLGRILNSFPAIDDLPPFYNELVRTTIDYESLKKSLGGVNWAKKRVALLSGTYETKLKRAREISLMNSARREFYGRIASVLKQISPELAFIEESRKIMKGFPTIKTSLKSVCIFGFPNVGKTTLLYKLTGSKPEINSYAFTTKSINIGYAQIEGMKVQFIDTPGTHR